MFSWFEARENIFDRFSFLPEKKLDIFLEIQKMSDDPSEQQPERIRKLLESLSSAQVGN